MPNNYSCDVGAGSKSTHQNRQLELDLGASATLTIKAKSYINIRYFSSDEIENICYLFDSCGHRMELRWLIQNIYNWHEFPKTEMGLLLRYADKKARAGMYVIMEKFAEGICLEQLLNQDFLYEQF